MRLIETIKIITKYKEPEMLALNHYIGIKFSFNREKLVYNIYKILFKIDY